MPRPFLLQVNDSVDYIALDDFLDFIRFFSLIPNMALFTFLWEIRIFCRLSRGSIDCNMFHYHYL
jgi:hypothetical protein